LALFFILSFKKDKMKNGNIFLATAAGTASMTLFSYLVSREKNKNFREPRLLGKMVYRAVPAIKRPDAEVAGWILHWGTGLLFTKGYKVLLDHTKLESNLPKGILLGVAAGAVAVIIWKSTFSLHPDPPEIDFKGFYKHLMWAHIVFTIGALLTLNKKNSQ
jgi:hypothetical protein